MKRAFLVGLVLAVASSAVAEIVIEDAYARAATPRAGAAFMMIKNQGDTADRLIDVRSDVSVRVELHTHKEIGDGIMSMVEVEDGFEIPAGGTRMLARGGDHIMFMGLNEVWENGKALPVTFVFENAGEIEFDLIVDLERRDAHGGHGHGNHSMHKPASN